MAKARILFLATHPKEVASTRYRVLAYDSSLRREGYETTFHPFFPSEALESLYAPRRWGDKAHWLLRGTGTRRKILRCERYDLLFIHRELFPLGVSAGMALLDGELRRTGCPIIYDFDDAIFLPHRQNRGLAGKLENPGSVQNLIGMSQQVIAGNTFLAEYAGRLNPRVHCIPTPVDTSRYFPSANNRHDANPILGWIGSPSTAKYLLSLAPVFRQLARTHRFRLRVIGAGEQIQIPNVDVDCRTWGLGTEAEEFRTCDIGLYPLWDDQWSRGKCGYKALQFMASGVPVVASAIGMNTEILRHRTNGLLVQSAEQWVESLSELLDNPKLRRQLGEAGRQSVEEQYSLTHLTPRFLGTLEETLPSRKRRSPPHREPLTPKPASTETLQDVLCISSIDWDFVWQGHQEIMSTLARQGHRVLFVENTGVRNPQFSDFPRMKLRLGKWRRSLQGFWEVADNLYVFSPLVLPFPYSRLARRINAAWMAFALKRWVNIMEFRQPICWTFLPTPLTLELIQRSSPRALIYYCIDSFADSTPAAHRILASEKALLQQADLVFVTSRKLFEMASRWSSRVHLFPFGVNLENFKRSSDSGRDGVPAELLSLRRPVVGYIGGIHQWIDQDLLVQTARACPDYSFLLVGPIQTNADRLRAEPNIFLIGQKPHEELPRYIRHFDVGIIPYRLTEYTKNVYPTKLNEYHVMGKPVVSTPLPEVLAINERTRGLVRIAGGALQFREEIEQVLKEDSPRRQALRMEAAEENSWGQRIQKMQELIQEAIEAKEMVSTNDWSVRFGASLRTYRRLLGWGIGFLLAATIFLHSPLLWFIGKPLVVQDTPHHTDAVVVFAGGVGESGQTGEGYQERVLEGVGWYKKQMAPVLLFVSGYTRTFHEADIMQALAESLNVPSSAILTETRVHHTYDYVLRVKERAAKQGWSSILVVTSPYHTRRAAFTFAKNAPSLKVSYLPLRNSGFYAREETVRIRQVIGILQEYLGILIYWIRGWI